jgi:hypothetical protein
MIKTKFTQHLNGASISLIDFTKTYCFNEFSDNFQYIISESGGTDIQNMGHLSEKEIAVSATWRTFKGKVMTANQIVELLHHDNKVPLWIDISVYESRSDSTVIQMFCSRRLREEKELMHPGLPPFHLQVAMPPDQLKVEVDGKFDVNWKKNLDTSLLTKNIWTKLKELF